MPFSYKPTMMKPDNDDMLLLLTDNGSLAAAAAPLLVSESISNGRHESSGDALRVPWR